MIFSVLEYFLLYKNCQLTLK